jgi:hypothetical protein
MKCSIISNPSKAVQGGLMAVNIDMEKTFDKMELNFLLAIPHKLGFHPIWIKWIRLCISTSSFSIFLNGSSFGLLTPSQGTRVLPILIALIAFMTMNLNPKMTYIEFHIFKG